MLRGTLKQTSATSIPPVLSCSHLCLFFHSRSVYELLLISYHKTTITSVKHSQHRKNQSDLKTGVFRPAEHQKVPLAAEMWYPDARWSWPLWGQGRHCLNSQPQPPHRSLETHDCSINVLGHVHEVLDKTRRCACLRALWHANLVSNSVESHAKYVMLKNNRKAVGAKVSEPNIY